MELETAASAAPTRKAFIRLRCMRGLRLGDFTKDDICRLYDVRLNTLNGGIRRFNTARIDGLIDPKQTGRPRKIPVVIQPERHALVQRPGDVDVTPWTGKKFHGFLTPQPVVPG